MDILNQVDRKLIIDDIFSYENKKRKTESLEDFEIYNDRIADFVYKRLERELGEKTACQMPIVDTINVGKRIVKSEAKIYTNDPKRTVETNVEADKEAIELVYEDGNFNSKLQKANIYYKYRNQSFVQVVLKDKQIQLRNLHAHNVDVIPDPEDPERALCYLISSFDKSQTVKTDGTNQTVGDADDYKSKINLLWITKDINFVTDGKGNLKGEIKPNEIGMMPIVDISKEKDFEFFVRTGQVLSTFTVQYNASWTDDMHIKRMQGFSVGVLSGDEKLVPQSMTIGPAKLLFLPSNPANPDSKLELDFKSPNPNLDMIGKMRSDLLSDFLVSRGMDASKVSSALNGSKSYSSAIERLLAMIDDFEASKEDFDLFKNIEEKIFSIVKAYLSVYSGTELLDPKYWTTKGVIDATQTVQFHKPEMIETHAEKLDNAQKKIDLGISDRVLVLMDLEGITEEEATKRIDEIDKRKQDALKKLIESAPTQIPLQGEDNQENTDFIKN